MTVNKKVNSKFYDFGLLPSKLIGTQNPTPGSVIYNELATANLIDFYLIPHKVIEGTATPTQYRLIYYNAKNVPVEGK